MEPNYLTSENFEQIKGYLMNNLNLSVDITSDNDPENRNRYLKIELTLESETICEEFVTL